MDGCSADSCDFDVLMRGGAFKVSSASWLTGTRFQSTIQMLPISHCALGMPNVWMAQTAPSTWLGGTATLSLSSIIFCDKSLGGGSFWVWVL